MKQSGFTLVELFIVVFIVGIMALIGVSAVFSSISGANNVVPPPPPPPAVNTSATNSLAQPPKYDCVNNTLVHAQADGKKVLVTIDNKPVTCQ